MPERKHITTGLDCWCHPHVEAYGDKPKKNAPVKGSKK